ncbi:MAG TPA: hypothetical protein VJU61_01845 [Polyangiaceae bacterium]|nr:hypothetical protein [Polyangiaceae bacterium]
MDSEIEESTPSIPVRQLRVDISGSNGAPRITRARLLEVASDTLPMPSLNGALGIVGYSAAGVPSVAMPFSLPSQLRVERSLDGDEPGSVVPLTEANLTLYLDAREDLARIEILGEGGNVVSSLEDVDFEPLGAAPKLRPLQVGGSLSPRERLSREFPHIDFLGLDGDIGLFTANPLTPVGDLVEITDRAAQAIEEALRRGSKAALGAVRTVAMAKFTPPTTVGFSAGNTLVVSADLEDLPGDIKRTVAHEATHNFQQLVEGSGDPLLYLFNRRPWTPEVVAAAERTVEGFYLQTGLENTWHAMHEDAVALEVAGPYLGSDWGGVSTGRQADILAAESGFASSYGGFDAGEDIAEYVSFLVIPEYGWASPACDLVKTAGEPYPVWRVLPYAKIKFLESLSLLSAAQVETCVGKPLLDGPLGIHLETVSLTEDVQGGEYEVDGDRMFGVSARTGEYQMLIRVRGSENEARGIHRFDDIAAFGIEGATNAILLSHDTERLRARVSDRGLVMLTELTPERISGVVFFVGLRNSFGLVTDTYPYGTFSANR